MLREILPSGFLTNQDSNELAQQQRLDRILKLCIQQAKVLTLKAPITTAADDKFCKIFPNFRKK